MPVRSSVIPNKPANSLPFLIERTRWGNEATMAVPTRDAQMIVNLVCHFGSSTYELRVMVSTILN